MLQSFLLWLQVQLGTTDVILLRIKFKTFSFVQWDKKFVNYQTLKTTERNVEIVFSFLLPLLVLNMNYF